MTTLEQRMGPLIGSGQRDLPAPLPELSSRMDYYKPTMSQLAYEKEPQAEVTFRLQNRTQQRLADYLNLEDLRDALERFQEKGWSTSELSYLGKLQLASAQAVFSPDFLDYLASSPLPPVKVGIDRRTNDLSIEATGEWPLVSFWETLAMAEVNELYFENYLVAQELDPLAVYAEGDARLSEKIARLKTMPGIKFADFGTRRHFSAKWQRHVLNRLASECPVNFIGTSNVGLAKDLGLKPIGTFAHEMPMVYAALAESRSQDIRSSQGRFLNDWFNRYGADYSIALTDTFGSDAFLADLTLEQAQDWRGMRHDSGDPFSYGDKIIEFYQSRGIDPTSKTIVFSDGLDIDEIIKLYQSFGGRINLVFGWGTTLTNDLGIKVLNIVMKAVKVNGYGTVKLSDNESKYTGSDQQIDKYKEVFRP